MSRIIDISKGSPSEAFKLLVGLVAPRPIGWISTISAEGVANLAPFSFFNLLSNNPPVLGFSVALSRGQRRKDTLLNVEATQCFVHNIVTSELAEAMNQTAEDFPYGVSEFEKVGLTPLPSQFVRAPRVKESPVNLECKLRQIVSLGDQPGNGQLILGEVVAIHINDGAILDAGGLVVSSKLKLLSRLGKNDYMSFGEAFSMERQY